MTDDLRSQLERALDGLYSFERELGGGGMSRVFVAEETSLGRKVVVKDSISSRLADWDDIYGRGDNTLARAQIAATLGREQEAVNLLLDAFSEGRTYARHYHSWPEFAALRDYPPFRALLASRD